MLAHCFLLFTFFYEYIIIFQSYLYIYMQCNRDLLLVSGKMQEKLVLNAFNGLKLNVNP